MTPPTTHVEDVPGIGAFTFRRRTIRDQVGIQAEARRILGGATDDKDLENMAFALAELGTLTVAGPEGWDLSAVDPFDEEAMNRVWRVYGVLRAAGARFRPGPGPARQAAGAPAG